MTGAELRDLRRAMDLTQAQLARALGLSLENGTKTVYRWEAGRQEVPGPAALAVRFLANRCGECPVVRDGVQRNPTEAVARGFAGRR